MKKRAMKIGVMLSAALLTMGILAGCGDSKQEDENTRQEEIQSQGKTDLTGTLTLAGSTSMEKLANALAEGFMEKHPLVTVSVEFTGSSAGIEAILAGTTDVGNSSRNLKEEEKTNGAVENIVAIDGIAVVVDPKNAVVNLSKEQLTSIYKGEITNWSEFGGKDSPIVVIGREAGSGTRGAFEELLEVEDECAYVNELDSTGAVMAKVASTPGSIGYVSLDIVDDSVIALALDDVTPTVDNIKAGNYFLSRPFVMATKGEIASQNDLVQEWFSFVLGDEGQEVAATVGLITVK